MKREDFPINGYRIGDEERRLMPRDITKSKKRKITTRNKEISLLMSSGRLLEEVKVMSEPSLVFWIRQAVTKDLTSSSKFIRMLSPRFQDDYHQIHLPLPTVNLWMILERDAKRREKLSRHFPVTLTANEHSTAGTESEAIS